MTNTETTHVSRLMSPTEAAAFTTMSKTLLRAMSDEGRFPQPLLIGTKRIAYVRAEIEAWVDSRIASRALAA